MLLQTASRQKRPGHSHCHCNTVTNTHQQQSKLTSLLYPVVLTWLFETCNWSENTSKMSRQNWINFASQCYLTALKNRQYLLAMFSLLHWTVWQVFEKGNENQNKSDSKVIPKISRNRTDDVNNLIFKVALIYYLPEWACATDRQRLKMPLESIVHLQFFNEFFWLHRRKFFTNGTQFTLASCYLHNSLKRVICDYGYNTLLYRRHSFTLHGTNHLLTSRPGVHKSALKQQPICSSTYTTLLTIGFKMGQFTCSLRATNTSKIILKTLQKPTFKEISMPSKL